MVTKKQKILSVSLGIAIALIIVGIVLGDTAVLGNMVIIVAFIAVVPFFIYKYAKLMWLRSLEAQFPNLIRDLADSERSGMSLPESIRLSSKSNYGKLTLEVQQMSNRLSWGTPLIRVLDIFEERIKESKLMRESLQIIKESYKSGGNTAQTLESVARDMVMIKETEAEKNSMLKQHMMLMYGIFYLFMGVAIVIIFVMVPMLNTTNFAGVDSTNSRFGGGQQLSLNFVNPCESSGLVFPCAIYDGVCSVFGQPFGISCYYLSMFFVVIVLQGLLMGLIAGQLGEGSVVSGGKHSLIMVFSAIAIFMFLAKTGLLPS